MVTRNRGTMHVHIDHLVLEGLAATAGPQIQESLQHELERLAAQGTSFEHGGDIAAVDAGTFETRSGAASAGEQLARAIHRGGAR